MYPATSRARDRFVVERRAARTEPDPWRYQDLVVEDEATAEGRVARVATVFLTGRECPWRCAMCDLWRHTTIADTPAGAIAAQVAAARRALGDAGVAAMKLYNAGSFFDPRAVPEVDYPAIAGQLAGLGRVVVESHPDLVGARMDRWRDALHRHAGPTAPALEVAIGLETAYPHALEQLNKRMSVETFARAADRLRRDGVALRVFLLVSPPFILAGEQDAWLLRSLDVALACGATAVSLVPTRAGNGALEAIAAEGGFRAPSLADVERSAQAALQHASGRARVFVDLWDIDRLVACPHCQATRRNRLHVMNLAQQPAPAVTCARCEAATS
jgi:hypothetical protein